MSPNLLKALGLATDAERRAKELRKSDNDTAGTLREWKPPTFYGLENSNPLTTLHPLTVGANKGFEIVKTRQDSLSDGDALGGANGENNECEWCSDDEGWDYEGMLLYPILVLWSWPQGDH